MIRVRAARGFLLAFALLAAGCAASNAFNDGNEAARMGNLDQAVSHYRRAVQAEPEKPEYTIALQRAMLAASRAHLERAAQYEAADQLEAALGEFKLASEYDPSNRLVLTKVATLQQTIRIRAEAARPVPAITQLRAQARAQSAPPLLNPASRQPLILTLNNSAFKDVLNSIAAATGINVTYDPVVTNPNITVTLNGVTLEEALNQIMVMSQMSYKVVNERTIFVFPDNPQKHQQYDEQVIQTFYVSHADVQEVAQIIGNIIRFPGIAVQPIIAPNRTTNTITVRASTTVMEIISKMISQNDKPRAEVVFDVEILEVDRTRAKSYGLNLSDYAVGAVLSPEVAPNGLVNVVPGQPGTPPGTGGGGGSGSTPPRAVLSPPPFNLNTITRGISPADFYLAVPTAIVRFLESDTRNKIIAKPQLRGAEGTKLSLNLGQEVPIVTTSYTPIATGGSAVNPLNSFQLKSVGINIDFTPRVTLEGDILLDLYIESSAQGPDQNIAGTNYPSFVARKVTTRLRLRDGESNLLAGLLREDERRSLSGFPGAIHVPVLKQLFSANDSVIAQTDIVMLLTPHIVRTNEVTVDDLKPIYVGSQGLGGANMGLGGPPPLFAPTEIEPAPPATTPGTVPTTPGVPPVPQTLAPPGTVIVAPPGSSPVPGTVVLPQATPPAATPTPAQAPAPVAPAPQTPPPAQPATPQTAAPPPVITTPGVGQAQIIMSPPTAPMRVGAGPYVIPLSVTDASRLSTVTLTLIFDPTKLRVRTVQEGSFMRAGGVDVTFTQQVNAAAGRIDITIVRSADATGASGTGLLAAVSFDAIAPGMAPLTLSGTATGPAATPMGLQFRPLTIIVQQ